MKLSLLIISVFTLFILISCSQTKQDSEQTQSVPALPKSEVQSAPVNVPQPVKANTTVPPSAEQNSAKIMLNPAHGEPNHRCDIPVGTPLNSAPANNPRVTPNNPIQATPSQNSNTSPKTSNNAPGPTIDNARQMTSSPTRGMASPTTGTKPRLNPPHGQQWHRCEIAVGSPLP